MKALKIILMLALALLGAACVDADDTPSYQTLADDTNLELYLDSAGPDESRTVSYLSERKWDGWERSPERVRVRVRSADHTHIHYFESLPVAYGWLDDRYDEFDILELMVANALTGRNLLDARSAYFLYRPGYERRLPVVLAYPSRREALLVLDREPERYYLRAWDDLDLSLVRWRDGYWDDWREDFGLVRSASVARYDGEFWDGWYGLPDRVLVRVSSDGRLRTHYFDSLPVAWAWLDHRYDNYELLELQIAGADIPGRLLPARQAAFLWAPGTADALPAVLAFATQNEARRYLSALGDTGFRLLDWDGLRPRLNSWSGEHWNAWRGNPRHDRGIARALESGLGRKLGLREEQGVVAGDRRVRERLEDERKAVKSKGPKAAGKSAEKQRKAGEKERKADRQAHDRKVKDQGGMGKSKDKQGSRDKPEKRKAKTREAERGKDRGKVREDRGRGGGKDRGSGGKGRGEKGKGGKDGGKGRK